MDCLECKSLEAAFEARLSQYNEARSAAYFRVSTELAARKNVDMERTRNELEEHQLICASAKAARDKDSENPVSQRVHEELGYEVVDRALPKDAVS
jgi:Na+-translocating ferredoxin:NAD+ oxidoreductase RnfC subunit